MRFITKKKINLKMAHMHKTNFSAPLALGSVCCLNISMFYSLSHLSFDTPNQTQEPDLNFSHWTSPTIGPLQPWEREIVELVLLNLLRVTH